MLQIYLILGALAVAAGAYKCHIHGIKKEARKEGAQEVVTAVEEARANQKKKIVKAVKKYKKKIPQKEAQARKAAKIDAAKDPEKFNTEAFKAMGGK